MNIYEETETSGGLYWIAGSYRDAELLGERGRWGVNARKRYKQRAVEVLGRNSGFQLGRLEKRGTGLVGRGRAGKWAAAGA